MRGDLGESLGRPFGEVSDLLMRGLPADVSLVFGGLIFGVALAYVQGWSHAEIAHSLGLKTASLKAMLWRARRKLMTVMKGSGPRAGGAR